MGVGGSSCVPRRQKYVSSGNMVNWKDLDSSDSPMRKQNTVSKKKYNLKVQMNAIEFEIKAISKKKKKTKKDKKQLKYLISLKSSLISKLNESIQS